MKRGTARTPRKILCVFPAYTKSFGTFQNAYPLMGVKAFMPPQGILTIASYMPPNWDVRFVDESIAAARPSDFAWADVVFVSGMHIQRPQIHDIIARTHRAGKVAALGGPSVSGCPEWYGDADYLHIGEMGDATDALIALLDESVARPARQIALTTETRLDLADFPTPAYEKAQIPKYFLGSVQFSSGCPYNCEFCDIPELYGNNPRLKTPEQITRELDLLAEQGIRTAVYFVDDNFIGNRKMAKVLLPHLVAWQKKRGYPFQLACEATLNIAKSPDLLEMMREAYFCTLFAGIETPDPEALKKMNKGHNNQVSILDAIDQINGYGIEVVSGIIMGLDSDTEDTHERIVEFVEQSNIPLLTINLLQALPRTPLHRRLTAEGRLTDEPGRESNVVFKMPYERVVAMWLDAFTRAYKPEALYARFDHQMKRTFPNRITPPNSPARVNPANIKRAIRIMANLVTRVGMFSDYRDVFWKMAKPALKRGDVEQMIHVGLVSHHLITFAREAAEGKQNASFYSTNERAKPPVHELIAS